MKLKNEMVLQIAMQQSAIDANCNMEDFLREENVITISKENVYARRYLKLPHICNLISYGSNVVATVAEEYMDLVKAYLSKYPVEHCFETPNIHVLNDAFQELGEYRRAFPWSALHPAP
jgi:hypothetical protein